MIASLLSLFCFGTFVITLNAATIGNPELNYFGRFNEEKGANWPGSGVRFNILSQNTTVTVGVIFNECGDTCKFYVDIFVDCAALSNSPVSTTSRTVTVQFPAVVGEYYDIELRKVTEASNGDATGIMQVESVTLEGAEISGKVGAVPRHHNCIRHHKMLVIGDSITAAYGVDGTSPCSFSASTENVVHSYATIVASELEAEVQVVAWSGKGVVRNYGDVNQMSTMPMPDYYNRTIATETVSSSVSDPNYWNPANFAADIVLVMLGTNDYSTQPNPTDEQFTSGLVSLLNQIAEDYPAAKGHVAAMCAPIQNGNQCANIKRAAADAGVEYIFIDPDTLSGGYGCDGHPSAASQQNIADVVAPAVKSMF